MLFAAHKQHGGYGKALTKDGRVFRGVDRLQYQRTGTAFNLGGKCVFQVREFLACCCPDSIYAFASAPCVHIRTSFCPSVDAGHPGGLSADYRPQIPPHLPHRILMCHLNRRWPKARPRHPHAHHQYRTETQPSRDSIVRLLAASTMTWNATVTHCI